MCFLRRQRNVPALFRQLECAFPRNAFELLFETPKPSDGYYVRGYLKIWPIVRACVYYQIWLQRADRTFRVDLPFKSPLEISLQAAGLVKLHLRQLLQDLPLKKGYNFPICLMSKQASNPLRETITPARGSDGPTPGIGVSTNPGQEVGVGNALLPNPGVSNPLLTPNPSSVSVQAGGPSSYNSPP
ncbi:hypothetical protein As57867_005647, partial [Aphanomyces stellatus]